MTLAQFAVAVGADPKWVQNAAAGLGRPVEYTVKEARHLGLVRVLQSTLGVPLRAADQMAGAALREGADELTVREAPDGSVRVVVDVRRYLSTFTAALSRALSGYEPRARGRPMVRERGVAAARAYGMDLSLLQASLRRTPAERIRQLDADMEFLRTLRRRDG